MAAGFALGVPKCTFEPTTRMVFLGIMVDTVQRRFEVAAERLQRLRAVVTEVVGEASVPARKLARLAGLLVSIAVPVPEVMVVARSVSHCYQAHVWDSPELWDSAVTVQPHVWHTVEKVMELLPVLREAPFDARRPDVLLATDASDEAGPDKSFVGVLARIAGTPQSRTVKLDRTRGAPRVGPLGLAEVNLQAVIERHKPGTVEQYNTGRRLALRWLQREGLTSLDGPASTQLMLDLIAAGYSAEMMRCQWQALLRRAEGQPDGPALCRALLLGFAMFCRIGEARGIRNSQIVLASESKKPVGVLLDAASPEPVPRADKRPKGTSVARQKEFAPCVDGLAEEALLQVLALPEASASEKRLNAFIAEAARDLAWAEQSPGGAWFTFHGLRHGRVGDCLRQGLSPERTMLAGRWRSRAAFEVYLN
eukprot:gene9506-3670_t